jgi:hypothetical protein
MEKRKGRRKVGNCRDGKGEGQEEKENGEVKLDSIGFVARRLSNPLRGQLENERQFSSS